MLILLDVFRDLPRIWSLVGDVYMATQNGELLVLVFHGETNRAYEQNKVLKDLAHLLYYICYSESTNVQR